MVPPVDTTDFGTALSRLRAAGLRVEVDSFRRLPPGTPLEGAGVGDQDPEPGTRVQKNSVVRLTMGITPMASPAIPIHHPRFALVPRVVGLRWPEAERRIGGGLWLEIARIAPLPAAKSARGLSAFTVASQRPAPRTRVPYMGVRIPDGVDMRPSTLTLTLAVR
jgi:beta-lactam-binding protein with PASTA domain